MASDTSIIEYLPTEANPRYVRKTLKPTKQQYLHYIIKEVQALNLLSKFNRTPRVIEHSIDSILMTYVGKKVTLSTLPKDWHEQVDDIIRVLESVNISHNDIQSEEILVLNSRLYIIDFQHWTFGREEFERLIEQGKALNRVRLTDREAIYNCLENPKSSAPKTRRGRRG